MSTLSLDRSGAKWPTMPHTDPISLVTPSGDPRRRILLVDDNVEGCRALARLLEFYDFEVITAGNGTAALQILRSGPTPDVVLTDMILPDLDGREISREAHALQPTPLVVMITGWDFGSEPLDHKLWGIDHVYLKPLDVSSLVTLLKTSPPQPN